MFRDRLPLDVELLAELIERLAIICVQAVEKLPSGWVGECFEYLVHRLYSLREYYAASWLHVKLRVDEENWGKRF